MRTATRVQIVFCLLSSTLTGQVSHQHHPPRSPEEYLRALNDPSREKWQQPAKVVEELRLAPTETIADIGAGGGYFSRRFAPHVARVLAVDIDERLLAAARQNAPANVETVLAAPEDPRLPDAAVDTVFFCNVLHHIGNRPAYYDRLARALKPGGRVVIVDFQKRKLPVGPPESMKLSREEVVREFEAAGFRLSRSEDFLPYQYFLFFQRAPTP